MLAFFLYNEKGLEQRSEAKMIHQTWTEAPTIRTIKCVHTDAAKFVVDHVLTVGKEYELKNETDEFYFIIDNSGKIGGFYKTYFQG